MSTNVDRELAAAVEPVERVWKESKDRRQEILDEIEAFKEGKMEEVSALDGEIRRCARVLKILKPELFAEENGNGRGPGRPSNAEKLAVKNNTRKISETKVMDAEQFVRDFLKSHDAVRQADLRTERSGWGSGDASLAFAILREEGILRKVRQAGNQKYFALTSEGEAGKTLINEEALTHA